MIAPANQKPKLLDQLRQELRRMHYSYQTEKSYVAWVKEYVLFHHKTHPKDMGPEQLRAFLTHLAADRNVAASTQNQALCAIVFLYKHDLQAGYGTVHLPYALERKYPNANREFKWQWVFPSRNLSSDPRSGRKQRHYLYQNILQKALAQATRQAGIRWRTFQHAAAVTLAHLFTLHRPS